MDHPNSGIPEFGHLKFASRVNSACVVKLAGDGSEVAEQPKRKRRRYSGSRKARALGRAMPRSQIVVGVPRIGGRDEGVTQAVGVSPQLGAGALRP